MHGGTITSGRSCTLAVLGAYWMSCISSFSKTTLPGLVATLRPTSKAVSSVIETRPLAKSCRNRRMPSTRLAPPLSSAVCIASGLVARRVGRAQRIDHLAQHETPLRLAALVQRRRGQRLLQQFGLAQVGCA